jgi:putative membrane protein
MRILLLIASGMLVTACDGAGDRDTINANQTGTMPGFSENDTTGQAGAMANQQITSEDYIQRAAMSDMFEIQSGNLAVRKANSDDTRTFAQMMITDHTASTRDLNAAIEQSNMTANLPTTLDGEHQSMMDRLQNLEGAEFDREYMSQQMTAHRNALALHQSYSANGDNPALKQFAQNAIPVVQKHHDRLQREGASAGRTGTAAQ